MGKKPDALKAFCTGPLARYLEAALDVQTRAERIDAVFEAFRDPGRPEGLVVGGKQHVQAWLIGPGRDEAQQLHDAARSLPERLLEVIRAIPTIYSYVDSAHDAPVRRWSHGFLCALRRLTNEISGSAYLGNLDDENDLYLFGLQLWTPLCERRLIAWMDDWLYPLETLVDASAPDSIRLNATCEAALRHIRSSGQMDGKTLAKVLNITAEHLRKHVVPRLAYHGVHNDRDGRGYYIRAASDAPSDK